MRKIIEIINEYDPGPFPEDFDTEVIQLASNENPFPPSEDVVNAIRENALKINRYPSPYYKRLKEKIAEYVNAEPENVAVSTGATDILRMISEIVLEPLDPVFVPMPSYSMYLLFSMLREARIQMKAYEGYRIEGCEFRGKLAFLCSPNNPTGNSLDKKVIGEFAENFEYVVVDEAYADFENKTALDLLKDYDNVIIVRSFSKFFGLAGMRIGYAVADERITKAIEKIRNPFAISMLALHAAIAALNSLDYYKKLSKLIVKERERMERELSKFFYVYESDANFLLVKHGIKELPKLLEDRGILVRDVSGLEGLKGYHFRVTVGRPEENDKFLETIREIYEDQERTS